MVKVGTRQFSVLLLLFGTGPEIELLTQLAKHLGRLVQCFDHPSELAQDNSLLCFYCQFWRCKSKSFVFGSRKKGIGGCSELGWSHAFWLRATAAIVRTLNSPSVRIARPKASSSHAFISFNIPFCRAVTGRTESKSCRFWRHWRCGIPHIRPRTIPRLYPHTAMDDGRK
jgi:Zn-finger protein